MPDIFKHWTGESNIYMFSILLTLLLIITYNPTLGEIYFGLVVFSYVLYLNPNFRSFPFIKDWNLLPKILHGLVHYAIFIYGLQLILPAIGYTQYNTTMSIIKLIAASNPVFAASTFLTIIAFGILIPRIETTLWARLLEWFAHMFKVSLAKFSFGVIVILIALGGLAVLLHTQAKGVTNSPVLLSVFIFFVYSCVLIIVYKETFQAVFMHMVSNTLSILSTVGIMAMITAPIFGFNPLFIYIALGVYLAYRYKLLKRIGVTS